MLTTNKIYRVNINTYLYIEVLYDGQSLQLYSTGNCTKESISLAEVSNKTLILIGGKPRATFDYTTKELITSLEIIPTSMIRNHQEVLNTNYEQVDYLKNQSVYLHSESEGTSLESELHTHFMEVLSGEQFLNIVIKYLEYIGLDENYELCKSYPTLHNDPRELDTTTIPNYISTATILSNKEYFNKLASELNLPIDRQVGFEEITKILLKRNALIDLVGFIITKDQVDNIDYSYDVLEDEVRRIRSDAKANIYTEMLITSLLVLKEQGVKYVELSYSNTNTIKKILDRMKSFPIEGITYKFLLSENRNLEGKYFKERYKITQSGETRRNKHAIERMLPRMVAEGYVSGFDLMGMEEEITPYDYEQNSLYANSLYDKLEAILVELNRFNDPSLVCRLHSGEIAYDPCIEDGKSNPERTLEIVEQIANNNGLTIPPPTIRLGHALHIVPNENYLRLLKKYEVIVEINASSNFALSNIKNMNDIPYDWYTNNDIPIVLGTDGGGFYLTTLKDEAAIAEIFSSTGILEKIKENGKVPEGRGR